LCFWWGPLLRVAHLRFLVGFRDSVLLISLVFCVVFLVGSMTACCSSLLFSVLCFWWGPWLSVAHLFNFLCCVYGGVRDSVLLIFLVFCVVFLVGFVTACCLSLYFSLLCFWWGPLLRVAHLRFLVGFRDSVLLISLVFCVVFLVGSVTPCCLSL
jgi:hypothetical protein